MNVLVVTGVAREARIAQGEGIRTVCSGGSPAKLRSILMRDEFADIVSVVSFGIGGGLNPALMPGHIVVADCVISSTRRWITDRFIAEELMTRLKTDHARLLRASVAGVDQALVSAESKAATRAQTGAAVVDMESHIAAEFAADREIPFAAIRVVCDPAGRGLPPLVNHALDGEGRVRFAGVLGSLMRNPGQIGELIRLGRDSRIAFSALEAVAPAFRRAVVV